VAALPARITAADFLNPPEFRGCPLAAEGSGRVGGVRLGLTADAGVTRLGCCYQQVPLRVLPPFSFGPGRPALLYLLNPTAGLFDGDAQLVEVRAGPAARALVVGQSATRVHPGGGGLATQQWRLRVDRDALLAVLPGPAIPFAGCRYYQRADVDLGPGAALIWGDVWLAGRYARGALSERFQFDAVSQEFAVRRAGRLVYRDRFFWRGPWDEATAAWHFGTAPAAGSLFVSGGVPVEVAAAAEAAGGAVFPTGSGDTVLRWLGPSEAVTAAVVRAALTLSGASWLAGHDLAPCHWFSSAADETG
jgi:urease accessory protein